jgi:hypothetical protein
VTKTNQDERRALKILHEKDPEDVLLASRFIDFLRHKNFQTGQKYKGTGKFDTPEKIAEDFLVWQERNQT